MPIPFKRISLTAIETSPEIGSWLAQFSPEKRIAAKAILLHLQFVTRDEYSRWLMDSIQSLPTHEAYAIYAVRKFPADQKYLWDAKGDVVNRPGSALGSEDLVYSLIANIVRSNGMRFFDHSSLSDLKNNKIHTIVLVDDSIGSGKRVSDFIKSMMTCKSFISWWSFGLIHFYILAFARTRESEKLIIENIPGSDHRRRKNPVSSKIKFTSEIVYNQKWLLRRWGQQYQAILDLCDTQKEICEKWRRGFGKVMSSIVFYHSVPNNIPGLLFYSSKKWKPLFPRRAIPTWLVALLENSTFPSAAADTNGSTRDRLTSLSDDMTRLLLLVKSGVRRISSLALRMDRDTEFLGAMLLNAQEAGLVSSNTRLTEAAIKLLKQQTVTSTSPKAGSQKGNRALYIPKSWCAGRATVQPPASVGATPREQADPAEDFFSVGGEAGEASLERSDAKAALPPTDVRSQWPSGSRKGPDIHGPLDSKEK